MIVTINTDASFNDTHQKGSFAFWITSDKGRVKYAGVLRKKVTRPEQAEFKCILNALHVLGKLGFDNIGKVIINTDCLNVIHLVAKNKTAIRKYRLNSWGAHLVEKYQAQVFSMKLINKIEMRHVKAHTSTDTKREWVNEWCDQEAKKALKNSIKNIKNG